MVPEHFDRFIQLHESGRRSEAATAIRAFVESFSNLKEKRLWSENYLAAQQYGHKIRHDLFEDVVFPALLDGYLRSDPWSLRWLAKVTKNLYQSEHLWQQVGSKSSYTYLRELLALCPDDEAARIELLSYHVKWIEYGVHEWSFLGVILHGNDAAKLHQCDELREDLAYARKLDRDNKYAEFFLKYESQLAEYISRLASAGA
jgi:hypothetical protein